MAWSLPELKRVFAVGVQHCMNSPFYGSVGQTSISISWFSIRTLFPLNPIVQSCSHSAKNQNRDTSMLGYCLLLQCSACPCILTIQGVHSVRNVRNVRNLQEFWKFREHEMNLLGIFQQFLVCQENLRNFKIHFCFLCLNNKLPCLR